MNNLGTLYGIGVGPGDPDLLTIKAAKVLSGVEAVFAASSTKNDYSRSLDIVKEYIGPKTEIIRLGFPMTRDQQKLDAAWRDNARNVAERLQTGADCACVTLGDPLIYSTFGYLLQTLPALLPNLQVEIIPGITSFQAAAAASHTQLCESGESMILLSGVADPDQLQKQLQLAENAVILKCYKGFENIRNVLDQSGQTKRAVFVSKLGHEDAAIVRNFNAVRETPHYLSLLLLGKPLPTSNNEDT